MARYIVESTPANEFVEDNPSHYIHGEFDTADAAIACAHEVIRASLIECGLDRDPAAALRSFEAYGDLAIVLGEPRVPYINPYAYARLIVAARLVAASAP